VATTRKHLSRRSWIDALKGTFKRFQKHNLSDWAAALTYYGVLSIFPALIALVSVLGLIGRSATQPLIDNLNTLAPGPARQILVSAITNLQHSRGSAGVLFFIGIGAAIWSASGYVGAFMRASNAIYDVQEERSFLVKRPLQLAVTIALLVMVALTAFAVVVTGGLSDQFGKLFGIGHTAVVVWDIVKWPVILIVVALMFSLLYWAAPDVKQPGFRWITAGGVFAVVLWALVSGLFAVYVGNFGSYNKTYGALGGVIAFLVWLWLSNIALLLGAELNAELEGELEAEPK